LKQRKNEKRRRRDWDGKYSIPSLSSVCHHYHHHCLFLVFNYVDGGAILKYQKGIDNDIQSYSHLSIYLSIYQVEIIFSMIVWRWWIEWTQQSQQQKRWFESKFIHLVHFSAFIASQKEWYSSRDGSYDHQYSRDGSYDQYSFYWKDMNDILFNKQWRHLKSEIIISYKYLIINYLLI
jgi:hypothetical protein